MKTEMNQTAAELGREYLRRLKRKMKLYREYPELFEDESFRSRYVQEGDRFAVLAYFYQRLNAMTGGRKSVRRRAA